MTFHARALVKCPLCLKTHDINEVLEEMANAIRNQANEIARLKEGL